MIFTMPDHWQDELRLFVAIVLMAGLAGALTGQLLVCLLLGLLVYLAWHLHQLVHLPQQLRKNGQVGPRPTGLWKGIARDVDELRESHLDRTRDLSWQLERFRDTVNTLPDAVAILDPSGRIDWSNPAR
jgi:two-component system phosphate regulon sensor histidine kinase PhoR